MATLQKGGSILPQATSAADLPAESMAETGKGTEAGPGGGTPQAAGDGSTAGLGTWLLNLLKIGTQLQGMNGVLMSTWAGVNTVSGHSGIPPGNHRQQADDLKGGPTVLGDKHREKSKGGGITVGDILPDLNRMAPSS